MLKTVKIPELGENIESATVAGISVGPGDTVDAEQSLLELEAGKATVEIPAGVSGVVKQLLVSEGEEVQVGTAIAEIEVAATADSAEKGATKDERPTDSPSSPSVATAGQAAQRPTATGKDEGSEADKEESAPEASPSSLPASEEDQQADREIAGQEAPSVPAARQSELQERTPVTPAKHVPAAPSVRRFAREIGIDVDTVKGGGGHGRVSIDDVKRHARELNERRQAGAGGVGHEQPPLPDFSKWGDVRQEKMSAIRFATARQVNVCWNMVPRVTHFDEADITELEQLRKKYADRAAVAGGKLTMAVMVVKTVAAALRKFPEMNASIDMDRKTIIYKNYVNMGIAVATPKGLVVPVIRDTDKKNMVQLAVEIGGIAAKCREGKITREELSGGTFTVTNLGSIGGSHFTPIVNYPEVGILGLGRAARRPVFRGDQIEAGLFLPLSLSYDHRLIDGADAARFVRWIADAIEQPLLISLEGE
ncbi:MAG: 2-oxo acid dehydrogenase subunit E2 [Lentisphaeria bacterium]|nr:2-oxo acid dehydrogenase subunit E2 [Lentisphaeria bacterium]